MSVGLTDLMLDRPRLTVPVSGRDHIRGSTNAAVVLLEYGDYECPFCRAAQGSLKRLVEMVPDGLALAYRHFPLTQMHPHAEGAAEAAESAAAQEMFWPMHELLFEHQERLGPADLVKYAATLNIDTDRFTGELRSRVHASRIREDFMSGVRSGVNGTPTFFVNGVRHNGGYDVESLLVAIEASL
jgi:protein-disulfide isomerase